MANSRSTRVPHSLFLRSLQSSCALYALHPAPYALFGPHSKRPPQMHGSFRGRGRVVLLCTAIRRMFRYVHLHNAVKCLLTQALTPGEGLLVSSRWHSLKSFCARKPSAAVSEGPRPYAWCDGTTIANRNGILWMVHEQMVLALVFPVVMKCALFRIRTRSAGGAGVCCVRKLRN